MTTPLGVYAAVVTPFSNKLEPNPTAFVAHCKWLLQSGGTGLAPFGTTGEGVSLSADQKILLLDAAAEAGLPMDRVIAGTGTCVLTDAVAIARAAVRHDSQGVLCLPPFYYKNPDEDGLFGFYSEIIQRIADDRLKIYLYHFPQMSSVPLSMGLVSRLITDYPNTVVGLKDSSGDWSYTEALLKEFPGFQVFSGSEEFLLQNLNAGGAGCISATANVTVSLARQVLEAWQNETTGVDHIQETLSRVRLALQKLPMVPTLKSMLAEITDDDAWRNMLPPLVPLTVEHKASLDKGRWLSTLNLS